MRWRRIIISIALCVFALHDANAMGHKKKKSSPVVDGIKNRRVEIIRDLAPKIGIDPDTALRVSARIETCNESGSNADGSYVCGECVALGGGDCVHGAFWGAQGARSVRYLFAVPSLTDGTIRHEVMHELLVVHYGVGGHPSRVTINRLTDGKPQTFSPGAVIGWRWPSLVNWALPQSREIDVDWGATQCYIGGAE